MSWVDKQGNTHEGPEPPQEKKDQLQEEQVTMNALIDYAIDRHLQAERVEQADPPDPTEEAVRQEAHASGVRESLSRLLPKPMRPASRQVLDDRGRALEHLARLEQDAKVALKKPFIRLDPFHGLTGNFLEQHFENEYARLFDPSYPAVVDVEAQEEVRRSTLKIVEDLERDINALRKARGERLAELKRIEAECAELTPENIDRLKGNIRQTIEAKEEITALDELIAARKSKRDVALRETEFTDSLNPDRTSRTYGKLMRQTAEFVEAWARVWAHRGRLMEALDWRLQTYQFSEDERRWITLGTMRECGVTPAEAKDWTGLTGTGVVRAADFYARQRLQRWDPANGTPYDVLDGELDEIAKAHKLDKPRNVPTILRLLDFARFVAEYDTLTEPYTRALKVDRSAEIDRDRVLVPGPDGQPVWAPKEKS